MRTGPNPFALVHDLFAGSALGDIVQTGMTHLGQKMVPFVISQQDTRTIFANALQEVECMFEITNMKDGKW